MIQRIVSGGQTGADRAALDFAIELDIPHGGWIPKGRLAEDGPLDPRYRLQEMPTAGYPMRTEQNVIDSDGTLIFSHGKLTGGSLHTQEMARKHKRPCLHINLRETKAFDAAMKIVDWIHRHQIKTLNVAGPRASEDPAIYDGTREVLKAAYFLDTAKAEMPDPEQIDQFEPRTVEEAVRFLEAGMLLRDKTQIARTGERDLKTLQYTLGQYIWNRFGLWSGNESLMESCRSLAGKWGMNAADLTPYEASEIIIRELREKLQKTHSLRALK